QGGVDVYDEIFFRMELTKTKCKISRSTVVRNQSKMAKDSVGVEAIKCSMPWFVKVYRLPLCFLGLMRLGDLTGWVVLCFSGGLLCAWAIVVGLVLGYALVGPHVPGIPVIGIAPLSVSRNCEACGIFTALLGLFFPVCSLLAIVRNLGVFYSGKFRPFLKLQGISTFISHWMIVLVQGMQTRLMGKILWLGGGYFQELFPLVVRLGVQQRNVQLRFKMGEIDSLFRRLSGEALWETQQLENILYVVRLNVFSNVDDDGLGTSLTAGWGVGGEIFVKELGALWTRCYFQRECATDGLRLFLIKEDTSHLFFSCDVALLFLWPYMFVVGTFLEPVCDSYSGGESGLIYSIRDPSLKGS
ncbi:hypothetical protein Tco_1226974, partial [Tanacetum coccineum]